MMTNQQIADFAVDAAAGTLEGIANGFSQADSTTEITYGIVARMLYEAAAKMRDDRDELVAKVEKEMGS
jgi:hypothetical protein